MLNHTPTKENKSMKSLIQASDNIELYLHDAIVRIDRNLGAGYAREHPELLAAFIQACAIDSSGGLLLKALEKLSGESESV